MSATVYRIEQQRLSFGTTETAAHSCSERQCLSLRATITVAQRDNHCRSERQPWWLINTNHYYIMGFYQTHSVHIY